jgi:hypothetical protein
MKNQWLTIKTSLLVLFFSMTGILVKGQVTNALNQLIPMEIVDERGGIHKTIGGIGFNVRVTIIAGVKYLDGCSDESYGSLNVEIIWYDANDETGKYTLQMMKDLGAANQEKQSFLGQVDIQEFAGGNMVLSSSNKACVNEITGPTGKLEYYTDAKYFCFNGTTTVKISLSSKIKPETVKTILAKVVEEAGKFDYSIYKTTVADEKE